MFFKMLLLLFIFFIHSKTFASQEEKPEEEKPDCVQFLNALNNKDSNEIKIFTTDLTSFFADKEELTEKQSLIEKQTRY